MSLERLQRLIDRIDALIRRSRERRKGVSKHHGEKRVTVYVDGQAIRVPERVDCHYAARGALGAPRFTTIVHEKHPKTSLSFRGGYTFSDGERFCIVREEEPGAAAERAQLENATADEDDEESEDAWAGDPDAWKRGIPPLS